MSVGLNYSLDPQADGSHKLDCAQGFQPGGPAERREPAPGASAAGGSARPTAKRPRLVTFFAVMYYAGLRPEEAINLMADNVILPPSGRPADEDWGELHIRSATPDAGSEWTDDGSPRERRQLKHRAEGDSRIVPGHPELTRMFRDHLAASGTSLDGRLFSGVRGGELPTITYRRAWVRARQMTLTAAEQASPLARRPYDLRHACLSTWLNGGVYPTQVAEWAGHSVDVLLRIYAKCVVGQDELGQATQQ